MADITSLPVFPAYARVLADDFTAGQDADVLRTPFDDGAIRQSLRYSAALRTRALRVILLGDEDYRRFRAWAAARAPSSTAHACATASGPGRRRSRSRDSGTPSSRSPPPTRRGDPDWRDGGRRAARRTSEVEPDPSNRLLFDHQTRQTVDIVNTAAQPFLASLAIFSRGPLSSIQRPSQLVAARDKNGNGR